MTGRFAAIWFRYLTTDWLAIRRPELRGGLFALAAPVHGRMVISAVSPAAEAQGVTAGMAAADARASVPQLLVLDDRPGLAGRLLKALGLWCIRYTPTVAVAPPDGLTLDISGCAHLWGGEQLYLEEIATRLGSKGYQVRIAIADTIGTAWAVARFGTGAAIVKRGTQLDILPALPPAALRLPPEVLLRLEKLGLRTIGTFMGMPPAVLRRRFGDGLLLRLRQALGQEAEYLQPLQPVPPYEERLPCLEPICTATGIEIAVQRLLETLCRRLLGEGKGLRKATLMGYRIDGKTVQVAIGTNRATANAAHLFKLFALKTPLLEPGLGIELFVLQAPKVEDADPVQEALWGSEQGLGDTALAELLDRLTGRDNCCTVSRYLPDEHHWPERSIRRATAISEPVASAWRTDRPRPVRLLARPEPIDVTAPIPDYPPMVFRYQGTVHQVKRADGPERIAREWWMDEGEHRDYYYVEDDQGRRYWLFRSGHYDDERPKRWFIHGFFA
ncbi:Y-family DNA polymerase [Parapedobacter lycopersici]|uniref:Y-family DNA polymerase n=1 Tax=Parapedobacter lycopersici TaxID=1864939 RepID=UPI00214D966C|nr:DNA polymerase Y family protein [Parapedobacter lycopersici]